ncbi:hypothetical protein ACEQ8H_004110 [Pleosporales sp. CAS-2024a]
MTFTNTLALVLALAPATLFAAPTRAADSIAHHMSRQEELGSIFDIPAPVLDVLKQTNGLCDLSRLVMPVAPTTALPGPADGAVLRHIALGRGWQNYTCASDSADVVPVAIGAVATLFNATCDAARLNDNVLMQLTNLALKYNIPTGNYADERTSGHHYFDSKKTPTFDLRTADWNFGWVQAMVDTKSPAPKDAEPGANGMGAVPWLKLNAVGGDYKNVYRLHTAGGNPPKTCAGLDSAFEVPYSAQYWFYA